MNTINYPFGKLDKNTPIFDPSTASYEASISNRRTFINLDLSQATDDASLGLIAGPGLAEGSDLFLLLQSDASTDMTLVLGTGLSGNDIAMDGSTSMSEYVYLDGSFVQRSVNTF
jgi:hypothetical protein